jgi:UDP-N-acetylglucosamine 1-carboxyvinyltransferase
VVTSAPEHTGGVAMIRVRPSGPLEGTVSVAGAKNSVLKLLAATLLAPGEYVLHNVPGIQDVVWMGEVLERMGCTVERLDGRALRVVRPAEITPEAPYELVERMRASIVVLGPLLASEGRAKVSLPGGDDFGSRPIDMHQKGLEALGARITMRHGYIEAEATVLTGARIVLEYPSVGATENALMAAVLAKGTTVIDNAAKEPEIWDLASFLNRMGANILGAGTSTITIEGVERDELAGVTHTVVPDRIEAATYLSAVAVAGGEITVAGARPEHMDNFTRKLGEMGMRISPDADGLWARAPERLRAVDVATLPYPGVATDYKPFLTTMLAVADGVGVVTENIFKGRFRYVDELIRMGADVRTDDHHAIVRGVERLSGAEVRAHDIRAGAALVIAGLRADGETIVHDAHHIARGYEDLPATLRSLGGDVELLD